jgi:excisionase family DNA binding protein
MKLLKVAEAASILNCSQKSVRAAVNAGRLPAVKVSPRVVRIPSDSLTAATSSTSIKEEAQ